MQFVTKKSLYTLLRETSRRGWCMPLQSARMQALVQHQYAMQSLAASWHTLVPDPYLRDRGRYRLRRYSVLEEHGRDWHLLPHEAHFQTNRYNTLHGGFARHYAAITQPVLRQRIFRGIVDWNLALLRLSGGSSWRVQAHQFRITAKAGEEGRPTPEGVHQDGADYVFIMLLKRHNVSGGTTTLSRAGENIHEQALTQPGECIFLDDRALKHRVSPIRPDNPSEPGWRDVLVLTFHRR